MLVHNHYTTQYSYCSHAEPPLAPGDLRVSDVTNQTLTLSWSPPPTDGSPLYDLHYTISYGGEATVTTVLHSVTYPHTLQTGI